MFAHCLCINIFNGNLYSVVFVRPLSVYLFIFLDILKEFFFGFYFIWVIFSKLMNSYTVSGYYCFVGYCFFVFQYIFWYVLWCFLVCS